MKIQNITSAAFKGLVYIDDKDNRLQKKIAELENTQPMFISRIKKAKENAFINPTPCDIFVSSYGKNGAKFALGPENDASGVLIQDLDKLDSSSWTINDIFFYPHENLRRKRMQQRSMMRSIAADRCQLTQELEEAKSQYHSCLDKLNSRTIKYR